MPLHNNPTIAKKIFLIMTIIKKTNAYSNYVTKLFGTNTEKN